jgi:hypothetical protein
MHMQTADKIRESAFKLLVRVNQNPRMPKAARDRAYDNAMHLVDIHEAAHARSPEA